jgi:NAD(P)-dependent dehydrogenase (short-subunit alcohol dehydrogenase family)
MTPIDRRHPIGSGFNASSTAADVLKDVDLSDRTALVTGGASGLGLKTTRALAAAGARVVVTARRVEAATRAVAGIANAEVRELDLGTSRAWSGSLHAWRDRCPAWTSSLLAPASWPVPRLASGRVGKLTSRPNHLGHYAVVNLLVPALTPGRARVVSYYSSGHFLGGIRFDDIQFEGDNDRWEADGQSKTANALMARHLATLCASRGISAFSVHPGSILTPCNPTRSRSSSDGSTRRDVRPTASRHPGKAQRPPCGPPRSQT